MPHSFHKIWIHAIWSTKKRMPLIIDSIENKLYAFLTEQMREKGCPVRIINDMSDHVHLLFLMSPQKSISEIIKQIKGSCSHWIHKNNLISEKFAWQTGYAASESVVEKVYNYIKNQKKHHQKKNFNQEYNEFLNLYDFDLSKNKDK